MLSQKLLVDNSALSLTPCERKLQLVVFQGLYLESKTSTDFGSAYHTAMEHLDKGHEPENIIGEIFTEAPKVDKIKLLSILIKSKTEYKLPLALELNSKPMIEHKFQFPWNDYIDLVGTIDRVYIEPQPKDTLVVLDYKTGADATEYKMTKVRREYEMSFQLWFYLYCLYKGILPASLVEAYIVTHRYRLDVRIAFYNSESSPLKISRRTACSDSFLNEEIPAIISTRIATIEKVANISADNKRAPMTGMNVYGYCNTCEFRNACLVAKTSREDELLSHFSVRQYNPLTFR